MKKILILLSVVIVALNAFAADDYGCTAEWQSVTNPGSPIEFWGDDYQPCLRHSHASVLEVEFQYLHLNKILDH